MSDAVDLSNFDNDDDDDNNNNNNNDVQPEHPSSFIKLLSDTTLTRLSQTEVQDLQYAFSLLDVKGTGSISVAQLMDLLQELWSEQQQAPTTTAVNKDNRHTMAVASSYPHNLQHVIQQLALLPPHQDLTQQDFVQLFTASSNQHNINNNTAATTSSLQSVFDLFSQGKSYIHVHDLQRVATELGENLSRAELHEMMQRVVVSSSGDDDDDNDNHDTNQNDNNNDNDNDDPKITLQAFCHVMNRNLLA